MKYAILMLFLCLSGCATAPKAYPGLWRWEEKALQDDLRASQEQNKALKQEIRYLERQLKEAYKAVKTQEKIYRRR